MGLIYDAIIDESCNIKVVMTLSTRRMPSTPDDYPVGKRGGRDSRWRWRC